MKAFLFSLCALFTFNAHAVLPNHCAKFAGNPVALQTIEQVANRMQYSFQQLCTLPRLMDIFMDRKIFINPQQQPEPHLWLTLHYNEYSCQYFIREADRVLTRSNCYNTW